MNARAVLPYLALASLLTVGCHQETPAQKLAAVEARGRALVLQGQYPQAITLYTKAIEGDGTNGSVYFHRGTARMLDAQSGGVSELDDAINDFTLAIQLDPKLAPSAYHSRGDAEHLKGDEDLAKEDWLRGNVIPK